LKDAKYESHVETVADKRLSVKELREKRIQEEMERRKKEQLQKNKNKV
jgi:hypothetical protein